MLCCGLHGRQVHTVRARGMMWRYFCTKYLAQISQNVRNLISTIYYGKLQLIILRFQQLKTKKKVAVYFDLAGICLSLCLEMLIVSSPAQPGLVFHLSSPAAQVPVLASGRHLYIAPHPSLSLLSTSLNTHQ